MTGSGTVTGFNLTSGGSGYTGAPTVSVSGDGENASGVATIATGAITNVSMAEGIVGVPIIGNYTKALKIPLIYLLVLVMLIVAFFIMILVVIAQ